AVGQIAGPVTSALLVRSAGNGGLDIGLQAGAAGLMLTSLWLWRLGNPIFPDKEVRHAVE
ncbi:MAG: hypothetical protein JWQ33_2065, partial [Ramlibacter sp.]|nr:hypothetical protein [Ramlibacter sp.]